MITGLGEQRGRRAGAGAPGADQRVLFADRAAASRWSRPLALGHGVRRALSPETRNRIRFEMRREVRRARKAAARRAQGGPARPACARQRGALAPRTAGRRSMRRGLLVRRRGRRRRLRDGPGPPRRRGVHRRGAARPAGRAGASGARLFARRGRARAWPRRKPSCASGSASCLMDTPSCRRGRRTRPPTRHRRTDEEGND